MRRWLKNRDALRATTPCAGKVAEADGARISARSTQSTNSRSLACSSGCLLQTSPCIGYGCSAIRPSDNRLKYAADRGAWCRHTVRSAERHCCGRVDRRARIRSTGLGPVNPRAFGRGLACLTGLVEDEVRRSGRPPHGEDGNADDGEVAPPNARRKPSGKRIGKHAVPAMAHTLGRVETSSRSAGGKDQDGAAGKRVCSPHTR